MKTLLGLLAVIIAATAFMAFNQRREISAARAELRGLEKVAERPASEAAPTSPTPSVSAEEVALLREANRDIHRLRGQITQAREQRREVERLQAENTQLQERIDHLKTNPEAAVPSFALSNKGQATPEAAIETAFWSMYHGDIQALSRVMPVVTAEFDRMPEEERKNQLLLLRAMASTIESIEVVERSDQSPDETQVAVRMTGNFSNSGQRFTLHRTNNVWQIVR